MQNSNTVPSVTRLRVARKCAQNKMTETSDSEVELKSESS